MDDKPVVLPVESIPLDQYSLGELLALRDRVTKLLPGDDIETLDLSQELVLMYQRTKQILEASEEEALNHRASVVNSLNSTLKQLTAMQKELFTASRLQKFEKVAAEIFKEHPDLYERYRQGLR